MIIEEILWALDYEIATTGKSIKGILLPTQTYKEVEEVMQKRMENYSPTFPPELDTNLGVDISRLMGYNLDEYSGDKIAFTYWR